MQDDREDRIRHRAHEIWEREGQPEGKHDEHWAQATAEIAAEDGATGSKDKTGTAKRAGKTAKGNGSTSQGSTRAKTAVGGAGSTRAAAENLSAVAGDRSEKAAKPHKPGGAKKDATG